VLEAIAAAAGAGLAPVKVNMVVRRGVNEQSVLPMAAHFRRSGHVLRFIEYMDVGTTNGWRLEEVVPAAEIISLIGGIIGIGAGIAAIATASSLAGLAVGVVLVGIGSAVMDVALFSLRQRVTDPAWFGRAFAVSMHLNYSGIPVGSALSGPLLAISTPVALTVAVAFAITAAGLTYVMVPSSERG